MIFLCFEVLEWGFRLIKPVFIVGHRNFVPHLIGYFDIYLNLVLFI